MSRGLNGQATSGGHLSLGGRFATEMRTAPLIAWTANPIVHGPNVGVFNGGTAILASYISKDGLHFEQNNYSGMTAGAELWWWAGGVLLVDAEL